MDVRKAEDSISIILMTFQLNDIKHHLIKRLNTGQKRKVQLGISLIGDPKVVSLVHFSYYYFASTFLLP